MKEASPHKESAQAVLSRDESGMESVESKLALGGQQDALGVMAGGWEGRHSGRSHVKRDLEQDPVGLVQVP